MSAVATPDEADKLPGAPHPRETPNLFGQQRAERDFLYALEADRLSHAWLITGPRGIGKSTLAWRMARRLLAQETGEQPHDLASRVYRLTVALAHPRLFLCRRPWDERNGRFRAEIPVDEIRALKSFFRLSAAEGGRRVAIIDAADDMNVSAANALLKLLEEPPEGGTLLLVAHQPARLLPTIRSRCRELRCFPLDPPALDAALRAAGAPAIPAGFPLAELVSGSAGAAFELLANDGLTLYNQVVGLLATAPPIDRRRLLGLVESAGTRSNDGRFDALLRAVALLLSRLARAGAGCAPTPVSEDEGRAFARLAKGPSQARLWADTAANLTARTSHARSVHLDPAQVILDTFLHIDTTAGEAAHAAA